ncbi:TonB-linked outer membrane protein, SusC/RagA family [Parapedobacter indicus]|uniref:TonB-linked outer membrane protein, SusC/RagA family n=1 Tax=Parapedobacter indicus TaxID=1477437 RepID=A0A1I3TTP8_9SPHI|nr:TonB-linked SusC/RagA family outer membrane protein [Parapedobacter indicus]SFJ72917.1 TonB-linked outer membrane protein, SusC/RagA family [Parapedobacter indicus]
MINYGFSERSMLSSVGKHNQLWRIMRLTSFLLLGVCLNISLASISQTVTLKVHQHPLPEVLTTLEQQTGFRIMYNDRFVKPSMLVSLNVNGRPLEQVLDQLLAPERLTYHIEGKTIAIRRKATGLPVSDQKDEPIRQERVISGRVTDDQGNPLEGVTVRVKETNEATTTNSAGEYQISVANGGNTLVYSIIGYESAERIVGDRLSIDVSLRISLSDLDEVVVIGYGSRQKKDVTTSISTIGSKEISKSISMTPELAMQGRMTGVHVSGNTGSPMARPTIRIRGVNTWGVTEPLYVIDGIPVTELGSGVEGQDERVRDVRGPINVMAMIDPNDIESISVLKDASAAAIYGVRAANGVVLITTKKGATEKPTIGVSARHGIQNIVNDWEVMNTQQYVRFYENAYAQNPNFVLDGVFNPQSSEYLGNTPETFDWQNAIINKNAPNQEMSVRVSGKTDATNYYTSASFASAEGTLIGERLDRYSFNVKLDNRFNKWLKTGVNYRLAYVEGNDNLQSNLIDRAETPPWQPIYDPHGPSFLRGFAQVAKGYDENGVWSGEKRYGEGTRVNSVALSQLNFLDYKSLRNMGNAFLEVNPLSGLSIKGSISIDWYRHDRFRFDDYNGAYFSYGTTPTDRGGGNSVGLYSERGTTNFNLIKELTVNYRKAIGQHRFDVTLNGMDQQYSAKYATAESEFMTTKEKHLLALGGENQYTLIESERFRWALQGLMGRLSYNFADKYYADVTVRRDGSNRFAPDRRWGTFPSASLAWRLTSEPFMDDVTWLNDLKFRVGWGQLGNQEVRPMAYLSPVEKRPTYAFGSRPGGDGLGIYGVGAAMFSFPNSQLGWEQTTTTNIGFDAQAFGAFSVSAEYYYKETTGILQETSIPPSVGSVESPVDNIAAVRNSGFELSLGYGGTIGKVNYNVSANLTTVKNRVLTTYRGIPLSGEHRIEAGYPMNYIYGYKAGGIFQNQAEIDNYLRNVQDLTISQTFQPGDRYFIDIYGAPDAANGHSFYTPAPDGVVNQYDRTFLGKTIPGYYYGFNFGIDYKGIDLSVFFLGVGDVYKYNAARATMEGTATRGNNRSVNVLNAWSPENPSTDIARAVVGDPNGSLRYSSYYVENASYLKLGNAQLGYTLPQSALTFLKNNVKYLRIYTSVNNGFILSNWRGLDPENDAEPEPRVFSFGINVNF